MQLSPERPRSRRLFVAAVMLSLVVHLVVGVLWPLFARTLAHDAHPERVVAQIGTITVERVPPTPKPTPVPTPSPAPQIIRSHTARTKPSASQRRLARVLAATPRPVPTLAPLPPVTVAHTVVVFHKQVERHALVPEAGSRVAVLSPNQIAAYEGAFQRTINQTHADGTTEGTGHARALSRNEEILGGTFGEAVDFNGTCRDYAPKFTRGGFVYHYLSCRISFSDGFSELASYPWPFRFPVDADPIVTGTRFAEATPPPGFELPPDFEPSRRVCTFYHAACAAKLATERAAAP